MPKFKVEIVYEDDKFPRRKVFTVAAPSAQKAEKKIYDLQKGNVSSRSYYIRDVQLVESRLNTFLNDLLKEDNPTPPPKNTQEFAPPEAPQDISLDQVIDRYLIRYEKESIPTVDAYEDELYGEQYELNTNAVIEEALNEADEDELDLGGDDEEDAADAGGEAADTGDAGDTGGLDLGGGDDTGGGETPEAPVVSTPQINLQDFARSVARLINNYEVLLNPKETILNRVEAYLTSNYDDRTAEELMDILDTNYGLRTAEENRENQENNPTAYSAGALASG